ncbi:MAG: pilus assembly PilX N-terminal domain-containing protein [Thiotrichaceae bacterium]
MKIIRFQNKQQGATLIMSLLMLVVMTIIGVSATKISSMDILIAGNDQQKMKLFQKTQSQLLELTTPLTLLPVLNDSSLFVDDVYTLDQESGSRKIEIVTKKQSYSCKGINGNAISIPTPCELFDFKIKAHAQLGGGAVESYRGAGKEVPPIAPNNFIGN